MCLGEGVIGLDINGFNTVPRSRHKWSGHARVCEPNKFVGKYFSLFGDFFAIGCGEMSIHKKQRLTWSLGDPLQSTKSRHYLCRGMARRELCGTYETNHTTIVLSFEEVSTSSLLPYKTSLNSQSLSHLNRSV